MRVELHWTKSDALDQTYVDHARLQRINEQFYLTFGQIRLPDDAGEDDSAIVAEIRPVAKVVMTAEALDRLRELLIRSPVTDSEEGGTK